MNSNNGWTDLGENIKDMVDSAVNSHDFRQLNENISRTVLEGLEGLENLGSAIKRNLDQDARNRQGDNNSFGDNSQAWNNTQPGSRTWKQNQPWNAGRATYSTRRGNRVNMDRIQSGIQNAGRNLINHPLFARTFGTQAGGTALMAVGYTLAGVSTLVILILIIVGLMEGWFSGMLITAGIFTGLLAGSAVMAWRGTSLLGRVRRFRKYVEGLGGRTYCSVKELADHLGKSEKYVRADLRKLIQKGWFKQGHLDRQGTCLIVSHETYSQYEQSQKQLEARQMQEQEYRRQTENLSDDVKEMINTGMEYIRKIEKSNDAIPGEEISNKISYMQTVVEKIFQRVKEHPECADDLRKFMDYYLPTTVKLLDAYEELDRQPVQGENIRNGKQEIEKTLDTLNVAFEKLLDSLFEDTAWDVSTDISVLHTMLAQEGLTESGMRTGKTES